MKAKTLLLFISFVSAPAAYSFGQVDCSTSTKLVCQYPVSATILATTTFGPNSSEVAVARGPAETTASTINSAIAAQLTQLPIPSASIGIVTLKEKGSDVGVPFDNLGPILTDRPDTVGKGHLFVGFSYQHFNFNSIDGVSLGSLSSTFSFSQPSPSNASATQTFYASASNNVGFTLDQYVGIATYGIGRTTDLSVVVPFNSVNLNVTSSNFQVFEYDSALKTYANESPAAGTAASTSGAAGGIGDLTVNLKQLIVGGEGSRTAIAFGATARFPTGNALNFLGSGAVGGGMYGLFEYRARIAPHLKVGYQWNGLSQVVNIQGGSARLPGGLQYAAGADLRVVRQLTVAFDVLGSQFSNAPSFALSPSLLSPAPTAGSGIPASFTTITQLNNTYTTANVSGGLKYSPNRNLLFYANVLEQVNNVGMKSNLVPLFGIALKR